MKRMMTFALMGLSALIFSAVPLRAAELTVNAIKPAMPASVSLPSTFAAVPNPNASIDLSQFAAIPRTVAAKASCPSCGPNCQCSGPCPESCLSTALPLFVVSSSQGDTVDEFVDTPAAKPKTAAPKAKVTYQTCTNGICQTFTVDEGTPIPFNATNIRFSGVASVATASLAGDCQTCGGSGVAGSAGSTGSQGFFRGGGFHPLKRLVEAIKNRPRLFGRNGGGCCGG